MASNVIGWKAVVLAIIMYFLFPSTLDIINIIYKMIKKKQNSLKTSHESSVKMHYHAVNYRDLSVYRKVRERNVNLFKRLGKLKQAK